jgi:hypothetical protein
MKLRVLLRRQCPPGENDHRDIGKLGTPTHLLQHLEAGHVRQPRIEHDAIARLRMKRGEGFGSVLALTISMSSWPSSAWMLNCSALLSSTTRRRLRRGCANSLIRDMASEMPSGRGRLDDKRECTALEPVLAVIKRDDLHQDVTRQRVLLELTEHVPAEHIRQENVERNGGGLVLLGEIERVVAAHREQGLEPLVARKVTMIRA